MFDSSRICTTTVRGHFFVSCIPFDHEIKQMDEPSDVEQAHIRVKGAVTYMITGLVNYRITKGLPFIYVCELAEKRPCNTLIAKNQKTWLGPTCSPCRC